jgi:hypothetical protein
MSLARFAKATVLVARRCLRPFERRFATKCVLGARPR